MTMFEALPVQAPPPPEAGSREQWPQAWAAARERVDAYAPHAPLAVRSQAATMMTIYLVDVAPVESRNAVGGVLVETDDTTVLTGTAIANSFRNSGAQSLLATWRRQRGVAV